MSEERSISAIWEFIAAVAAILGITKLQFQIFIKVLWVLAVTIHIAWVCGLLATFGFASPFASAADVEELQRAASISAKLQITQELRTQTLYWCAAKDQEEKNIVEQTMARLKDQYVRVSKGEMPPEFKCPEKRIS